MQGAMALYSEGCTKYCLLTMEDFNIIVMSFILLYKLDTDA